MLTLLHLHATYKPRIALNTTAFIPRFFSDDSSTRLSRSLENSLTENLQTTRRLPHITFYILAVYNFEIFIIDSYQHIRKLRCLERRTIYSAILTLVFISFF